MLPLDGRSVGCVGGHCTARRNCVYCAATARGLVGLSPVADAPLSPVIIVGSSARQRGDVSGQLLLLVGSEWVSVN